MKFDILDYYKMIDKQNVNIIYSGPIWSDGIEDIVSLLKKRLEYDELPLSASQSVFSVFVEQMNNVSAYSVEAAMKERLDYLEYEPTEISKGVFILGARKKTYFIQSGNIINNESVDYLKSKIDYINSLDKLELRTYYKEQIKLEHINFESKGINLGLIEIARRASSKIDYTFSPLEDNTTFFSMYVTIG